MYYFFKDFDSLGRYNPQEHADADVENAVFLHADASATASLLTLPLTLSISLITYSKPKLTLF